MRIFISYGRGSTIDRTLAVEVAAALAQPHTVFVDSDLEDGHAWGERVDAELRRADVVVVLLSSASVRSELLIGELLAATRAGNAHAARTRILPVRLADDVPLPYPLDVLLATVPAAMWHGPEDTPQLIAELHRVLETGAALRNTGPASAAAPTLAPLPVAPLEPPAGTIDPQSAFYIDRPCDPLALTTIVHQGVTITIKGPRQMGKSSLLVRTAAAGRAAGKRVALLDFQLVDSAALASAELFLRQLCAWLSFLLKVPDQTDDYWGLPLGNIQRCTAYVEDHLLPAIGQPLVLALDEVDALFDTDFRSDFFGMLRGWHNARQGSSIWRQLDLVLVTSTEPYQLVANLNQSPFNVGQVIAPEDFTVAQIVELNRRHGAPFSDDAAAPLHRLLGGQPFLVRQALYVVASGQMPPDALLAGPADERGPFGDHLRYHLLRMHRNPALVAGMQQVIAQHQCDDEDVFFRLRGAGLVRREGRSVVPRCALYADYFRTHLDAPARTRDKGRTRTASSSEGLSPRELEVLRLVAQGLSNAQIAARLVIAPGTVNVHLNTIYGKLGVSSRTAATRYALDHGLA